jgi:hypothetical protein
MTTYVEYSADTSKYESAMAQMEAVSSRTLDFIKDNWLGLGTAIGLAHKMMGDFSEALDTADQLNKLSQSTGIATEELSAYKYASELAGVSLEDTARSVKILSEHMVEAAGGSQDAQKVFELLGITVKDQTGHLQSADAVLKEVADRFSRMPDGVTKAALAVELFGKRGTAMIPLLNQGAEGLDKMRGEAERLGLIVSGDTAKAAEALNDNLNRLGKTIKGSAYILLEAYVPALEKATTAMTDFMGITGDGAKKHLENQKAMFEKQLVQFEAGTLGPGDMDKYLSWIPGYVTKEQAEQGLALMRARIGLINKTLESMKAEAEAKAVPKTPLDITIPENWGKDKGKPQKEQQSDYEKFLLKERMAEQKSIMQAYYDEITLSQADYIKIYMSTEDAIIAKDREVFESRLSQYKMISDEEAKMYDFSWIMSRKWIKDEEEKKKSAEQGLTNMLQNSQYVFKELGKQNKAAFVAYKAFAIAETLINTYKAAMGAYSAMASIPYVGPILAVAAAAAAVAAGMAKVSAIASTEPGGGAGGGAGAIGTYSASPTTGLPTGIPAGAESPRGRSLQIVIEGNIIGDESYIEMLAEKISKAVEDRDVRLVATDARFAQALR